MTWILTVVKIHPVCLTETVFFFIIAICKTEWSLKMTSSFKKQIRYSIESPDVVKTDILVPMEYQYQGQRDIDIVIRQPEYTSICPMTGLPDVGCITITYRPRKKIIELKSLKFYLLQYRNVGIFYEHVVNRILEDLVSVLEPKYMEVAGDFTARGGITTKVSAVFEEKSHVL
jgi:7-cyano-7-deazaguanine reductase